MAGAGKPKTGGRKPGSVNKENRALREMILEALHGQKGGGVAYLIDQAQENPSAFLTLLGKVLPMTVSGDPSNPLTMVTTIELVALKGK